MSRSFLTEILGWYGVVAIVGAYALLSFSIIDSGSILFQLLNLTGALGIMIDSIPDRNWQPVVLNIIWAAITLAALGRIVL